MSFMSWGIIATTRSRQQIDQTEFIPVIVLCGIFIAVIQCCGHVWYMKRRKSRELLPHSHIDKVSHGNVKNIWNELRRSARLDALRGVFTYYVMCFHILMELRTLGYLPPIPYYNRLIPNPVAPYLAFVAVLFVGTYIIMLIWKGISLYACYLVQAMITVFLISAVWIPSQVSGICILMVCIGISAAITHTPKIKYRKLLVRLLQVGGLAGFVTIATYIFIPLDFVYFGALHCIALNSFLSVIVSQCPNTGLPLFLCIQGYSMIYGMFPFDVPIDKPTVDVMPWVHNFGYCCLGIFFHKMGWHDGHIDVNLPGLNGHPLWTIKDVFSNIRKIKLRICHGNMKYVEIQKAKIGDLNASEYEMGTAYSVNAIISSTKMDTERIHDINENQNQIDPSIYATNDLPVDLEHTIFPAMGRNSLFLFVTHQWPIFLFEVIRQNIFGGRNYL